MRNSVSDRNLFIESEEEEEDDGVNQEEGRKARPSAAGDCSDGSDSSSEDGDSAPHSKPNSYSTNWPQSYR